MAKTSTKAESEARAATEETSKTETNNDGNKQAPQQQVQVNDSRAVASYANFCRVTSTPEELIIDLGLNKQPSGTPTEPIEITQRVIVNFFTAKRLLMTLQMSVQRHETLFGVLETNVQKRVVPGAI